MQLTLFGGLLAVLMLFALARAFRLSAEVSGLLSAGLPLLAYFLYLFRYWTGLDVVAIHIAVFVSAAFLLIVFSRYRAGQNRLHWVPKALIAFFALLAVMNAGFLYVATKGLPGGLAGLIMPLGEDETIHTGFSGTTRHGQEAAKAISADLSRQFNNDELGWSIRVEGLRQPGLGDHLVLVHAEDANGQALTSLQGEMRLGRPGATQEVIPLVSTGQGQYEGRLTFAGPGLWLLELRLDHEGKSHRQSWEISLR
jgi:hypothetical protein